MYYIVLMQNSDPCCGGDFDIFPNYKSLLDFLNCPERDPIYFIFKCNKHNDISYRFKKYLKEV